MRQRLQELAQRAEASGQSQGRQLSEASSATATLNRQRLEQDELSRRAEGQPQPQDGGTSSPTASVAESNSRSVKERQLADLRAQIARCGRHFGSTSLSAGLLSPADSSQQESEKPGLRSPTVPNGPSFVASRQGSSLEEELAWTVQQMEVHRRQIEAHQRQLSILERRHAELVTVLTPAAGRGGTSTPGSFIAGDSFALEDNDSLAAATALAVSSLSEVASNGSGGRLGAAMAAAEARLGLRNRSRPTSASSAMSLERQMTNILARTSLSRNSGIRPTSASSGNSTFGVGTLDHLAGRASFTGLELSEENPATLVSNGLANQRSPLPSEVSGIQVANDLDDRDEAFKIAGLLEQINSTRPLKVQFVPLDGPCDSDGYPYLHGSLEVRLQLSDDGNHILIRVANSGNGKLFEINEFIARAEAIDSKRRTPRPNTIAEESELTAADSMPRSDLGASFGSLSLGSQPLTGRFSLSGKDSSFAPPPSTSSQPWKQLFKAHWPSK